MPKKFGSVSTRWGIPYKYSYVPIFGTDVTSCVGWYATNVDNYSQDDETNAGGNFQCAEKEFDLIQSVVSTIVHEQSLTSP